MEYTDDLGHPAWFTLSGSLGTGGVSLQTDFLTSGVAQRFYRVRVETTHPYPQD